MPHLTPSAGRRLIRAAGLSLLAAALLCAGGCATYSSKMADLRPQLQTGDFDGALQTVEKTGSKDQQLAWLERGIIHHYADRYAESNAAFAEAERLADEIYGTSLAEGALSLLSNDNAMTYRARPYELALVPYFKALNYAYLGQRGEAVVEARRASVLLAKYVDMTLEGLREQDRPQLDQVKNDAFLLYFSGLLYDWDGEINDAFVAYRNAAVAFEQNGSLLALDPPPSLARDLARTADRLGFQTELKETARACPSVFAAVDDTTATLSALRRAARWRQGEGEVVLLIETGFVPRKEQIRFDFPIFANERYEDTHHHAWYVVNNYGNTMVMTSGHKIEYWVSVAAPELNDGRPGLFQHVRAAAGTPDGNVRGARVANVSRQARVTFDAEKPTIFFRTVLRGLTKYLASRGAKKAGGETVGLLANLFGAATESADTRRWLTLPEQIHLVRLSLPAGEHVVGVDLLDASGAVAASIEVPVTVRAGDFTFVSRRAF